MNEWCFNEGWNEETLLDGNYSGFVYLFQFEDGSSYIGSKQMYKRVKIAKRIKDNSIENGWRDYSSSSKIVNRKIDEGMNYTRTILYAFSTMKDTLFVEMALIINQCLVPGNLNLAIMSKCKLPTGNDAIRLRSVLQELYEILN